jgi:uncharacterized protein (PEP-CTERM system associated)
LLATASWSGRAGAQLIFNPDNGFIDQVLNPPATPTPALAVTPTVVQPLPPVLGTTDTLPPFFGNGLGFIGAPASYGGLGLGGLGAGGTAGGNPGPAVAPTRLTMQNPLLPPLVSGAAPIQAGDSLAPAIMVTPSMTVTTGFDDNPRQTQNRLADSVSDFSPALIVSADTPHLQGVLTSSLEYLKYARATDQDLLTATGTAYGLATIAPDHLYLDARGSLLQVSPSGNGGFANPQLNGFVTPQTVLTTSISPVWRQSFGDLIETDLRYNYGSVLPIGALSSASSGGLSAIESNQGALTVAVGKGGGTLSSRAVLSAADIASQSDAASTQVRGFTDLQYRFNPEFALTARGGYENLRFQNAGIATAGPIATLGTYLNLTPTSVIGLKYGRENGTWGFSGAVNQALTPRTVLLLSYQRSLGSQEESILGNLNASSLDSYGNVVDTETSLPLALANPEIAYNQTGVFRFKRASAALEHEFETDSLRLFAFYEVDSALSAGTASDTARGAEISWFRTMTPSMKGAVTLGYASETGDRLLSLGLSLTMNLRTNVDAVFSYQFTNGMSGGSSATAVPSFTRNFLLAGLRASF